MLPYLVVAIIPWITEKILISLRFSDRNKRKKIIIFVTAVFLFVLIGFKSISVGSTDSGNYRDYWNKLKECDYPAFVNFTQNNRIEIGFLFSVWVLSRIFVWDQFIFILSALFYVVSVSVFVYRNCEDVVLSLIMFICLGLLLFFMQGMRQSIAMCILLWAIERIKKRNFILFTLLVVLAFLFHKTAIVFFICYFFYKIKVDQINIFLSVVISVALLIFSNRIISIANYVFDMNYFDAVTSGAGYIALAIYVLIIGAALIINQNTKKSEYALFFYITLLGGVVYIMRYFGVAIAERVSFYFMFGQMPLMSYVLATDKYYRRDVAVIRLVIIVLCIALFAYRLYNTDLLPYRFFWS